MRSAGLLRETEYRLGLRHSRHLRWKKVPTQSTRANATTLRISHRPPSCKNALIHQFPAPIQCRWSESKNNARAMVSSSVDTLTAAVATQRIATAMRACVHQKFNEVELQSVAIQLDPQRIIRSRVATQSSR